jgi:small subunit ribosomal protein S1
MSEILIPGQPDERVDPSDGEPLPGEDEPIPEDVSSLPDLLHDLGRAAERPESSAEGVLTGTVVSVRSDGAFIDIGRKSEAFLPIEAPRGADDEADVEALAIGDQLAVSIAGRSPDGYPILSRVIAERPQDWAQFEAAYRDGVAVAGTVKEVIKGGLSVDIGVRAFMPASRTGVRDSADLEKLVGEEIRCRIIQLDLDDQNVVVDRRVLLEEERDQQRRERIASLEPGTVVTGTVRGIRDFGAFVDLGGVDGLLHVSDIAWSKVKDVASVLSEGQQLDVKVLKIEDGGERISVGLKQLTPDPWTLISEKFQVGDRIKGTVTRLKDFGAFVELEPGVEGLIHVSEMSWARRVKHPKDMLSDGDVVDAVVLELKPEERRIGLGLKQALGDPWEKAEKDLPPGTVVEGTVRNMTNFGAFVEVSDGIEGLLHVSDITSEKRLNHPSELLKADQKIKVAVIELDRQKRRLKLGMKQLEPDAQDDFLASCKAGETVTGRVVKVKGDKAFVELGEGVRGICLLSGQAPEEAGAGKSAREASKSADVSSLSEMLQSAWKGGAKDAQPGAEALQAGQVRSFRITSFDPKKKTIELTSA